MTEVTFNPEHCQDANGENRWLHVECPELTRVSDVLCESEGGAGSEDRNIFKVPLFLKVFNWMEQSRSNSYMDHHDMTTSSQNTTTHAGAWQLIINH